MKRRDFLTTTAASMAGGWAFPGAAIAQAATPVTPAASKNGRLNIAMIGAGNIAGMALNGCEGEHIVAMADVDQGMLDAQAAKPAYAKTRMFTDFRVMLDAMEKEIDAVCINTPDHTHFVATMDAMQRGMHVCTQKPLTHNIWEARTLKKAKDRYGVVTNMAVQGHTYDGIRQMREWVEADILGQVTEVHAYRGGPHWVDGEGNPSEYWQTPGAVPPPAEPVPSHLDWELWKGPSATELPYNGLYHPKTWRAHHAFGLGMLGDWMPHIADGPVSILDLYDPVVVELEAIEGGNQWVVPDASRVRWDFPQRGDRSPCTFYWYNGSGPDYRPEKPEGWTQGDLPGSGSLWIGDKRVGFTDERSNKPRLGSREAMRAFRDADFPPEVYPRIKGGPFKEWIAAIKGDGPEPGANFDFAAPFTEMMLLGVLAVRFGGRIEWDPKKGVTNRPELNVHLKDPVRPGWEYGLDL